MAGLRLGAVMGRRDSLAFVRRAMPPYPVNLAALAAGVAAVEERKTIDRYVSDVKRLRTWFARELQERGVRVYPSAANFLLADFGKQGPEFFRKLARHNILVRERSHDIGPGYVRITIGTETELKKLLRLYDSGC
jgi:histidinol-phosphate aminotransferase